MAVGAGCSASRFADAGRDLGVDAGPEMGVDAGADLATDSGPYDAGPCPMSFYTMRPAFDRSCTTDADCTVGIYFAGCCGPTGTGINVSQRAAFDVQVAACNAIPHTDCGCADHVVADDGSMTYDVRALEVHCRDLICSTTVHGSTPCGPTVCAPGIQCRTTCEDGGVVPEACMALPDCSAATSECDCFSADHVTPCGSGTCVDIPDGGYTCTCS